MVFVVAEGNWDRAGWRRVKRGKARKADIIRCSYCGRSAVLLDHSWPYCAEATVCARHKNWQKHYEARFKEKP
jgi:ribosomal protein S27AE